MFYNIPCGRSVPVVERGIFMKLPSRILYFFVSCSIMLFCTSCKKIDDAVPAYAETLLTEISESAAPASETVMVTEAAEIPEPKYVTVSLAVTGDNLIHSSIYEQANRRAGGEGYDFGEPYENVAGVIRSADIAVINQETLICNGEFPPSTYPMFNSPPELGDHMIDIGFDVFTIANNHTLDKGTDGLSACLDYWDSRPEAVVCGAYRDKEDESHIRTLERDGVIFSFLSYTESLNGLSLPEGSPLVIGRTDDIDLICEQIKQAKEISDVCVVALHWGVENSDIISDYQRMTAKTLADAGADIIIGNHPHVLRGIEEIERDDGSSALCAYSMGNFISAQSVGQNLIGGILQFDVTVCTENVPENDKGPIIRNIELLPVITHYEGRYQNIKLYFLSDYPRELADSHGVRSMSTFGYDYIFEVLERNIDDKYFDPEKYYEE